ncbi:MAG: hypothetical protein KatS3mg049_3306 [Caldilinea sp.]|jgi:hypothetical protein|nr:MAG: hypothetical protein KatS3mg049_3306 [Caldilinea sp.]
MKRGYKEWYVSSTKHVPHAVHIINLNIINLNEEREVEE